ncbi:unnamed protein product [Sphenostylis stenocarpa]|uniref:Uncharacterized protein n=1 Tax=Sphenostylis stenocarpa TaxID=92480 RepID=A0AA86SL50_9FABA|nr:unnamed protein product [Sphenostylis stenocarpa]
MLRTAEPPRLPDYDVLSARLTADRATGRACNLNDTRFFRNHDRKNLEIYFRLSGFSDSFSVDKRTTSKKQDAEEWNRKGKRGVVRK